MKKTLLFFLLIALFIPGAVFAILRSFSFSDVPTGKAQPYILQAVTSGWMEPFPLGGEDRFYPKRKVTRAELAETLVNYNRTTDRLKKIEALIQVLCFNQDNFLNNAKNVSDAVLYENALKELCTVVTDSHSGGSESIWLDGASGEILNRQRVAY